jgi:cystathionine beta-lyase/cystathionine gamma-synthase
VPERHLDTVAITSGRDDSGALAPALWPSTVWESTGLDDTHNRAGTLRPDAFYSRYANPTVNQFEQAITELEGSESALAFASGMGALAAVVFAFCGQGSHIVAQHTLYGGTLALLEGPCKRMGIDTTFVDASVPGALASAVIPGKTMLVIVETPSNPRIAIADLAEVGAISGPFTVVDSTMATPLGQQPLSYGIDLVVHSATKGIGGHNDALLGVVAGEKELIDALWQYAVLHGASASPHDALNALRGIRTLPVRIRHQNESALSLARALEEHSNISWVGHPFLESHPQHSLAKQQMTLGGSIVSFEVTGGIENARKVLSNLTLVRKATSFGGPETLICHPMTSTHIGLAPDVHAAMGVTEGLLRVSVGLEDPSDIIADISQAVSNT